MKAAAAMVFLLFHHFEFLKYVPISFLLTLCNHRRVFAGKICLSYHSCGKLFIATGIGCVRVASYAFPIPVNELKLTHIYSKIRT